MIIYDYVICYHSEHSEVSYSTNQNLVENSGLAAQNILLALEGVSQNLGLINGRFPTLSSHFFTNYINSFHEAELVQKL